MNLPHPYKKLSLFSLLAVFPLLLGTPSQAEGPSDSSSSKGGITVYCSQGKAVMNGKSIVASCGLPTPSITRTIPKMVPCVGSAYRCMKGKQCIDIVGGIKFHMPHCGSGGQTTGKVHGAGCVELSTNDFLQLKKMVGQKMTIIGLGRSSGRATASSHRSRRARQ